MRENEDLAFRWVQPGLLGVPHTNIWVSVSHLQMSGSVTAVTDARG